MKTTIFQPNKNPKVELALTLGFTLKWSFDLLQGKPKSCALIG